MLNPYITRYLEAIKNAQSDLEICEIVDKIYTDGFTDGINSNEE